MSRNRPSGSASISDLLALPLSDRREIAFNLLWSLPRDEVIEATKRIASMMQKDFLRCLPVEIASQVVSHLNIEDLLSCSLVSQTWNRICNDQGVWAARCLAHDPPIRPAQTSWSDIKTHRQLMSVTSSPIPDELNPEFMDDQSTDLDDRDMPGHHPPPPPPSNTTNPGLIGSRGGFAGVRQSVWERTGLSSLPIFTSSPVKQSTQPSSKLVDTNEPIISSYLPDTESPEVNYKHLYLTHRIISSRIRTPSNPSTGEGQRPLIVDAISSIEAGGLPGHSEAIYSLALFRHPLAFNLDNASCLTCDTGMSRGQDTEASGRDWLLSGSRDKTLRLWQLDHPKPRVVKVFMGGHTGSVLSTFVVKLSKASAFDHASQARREKILAVSGGSDGRICSWDIKGDGTPEKQVSAHTDSVLCVKGDTERIVSCSKDRTIKVLDINTLETLITIGDGEQERHRGAINEVDLSKEYIISASGDRSIRIWDIKTGAHLFTLDSAHPRGIASLDFLPAPNSLSKPKSRVLKEGHVKGTIVTGSSDATIRLFDLVSTSWSGSVEHNRVINGTAQLSTRLGELSLVPETIAPSSVSITEGQICWTDCLCPPPMHKVNSTHCMRCWNRGHTALVRTLYLKGKLLISGGYDGTVKVWDKETGRLLNDLIGSRHGRVFAVTTDSTRVISTGLDYRINIWNFGYGLDTSFVET